MTRTPAHTLDPGDVFTFDGGTEWLVTDISYFGDGRVYIEANGPTPAIAASFRVGSNVEVELR